MIVLPLPPSSFYFRVVPLGAQTACPLHPAGLDLNSVFRYVLFCFSFCFVVGGPGGGFGGPGGGFLLSSPSSGSATTFTTNYKATTRSTKTTPRATDNKTKRKTKQNITKNTV